MKRLAHLAIAAALAFSVPLAGCSSIGSVVSKVVVASTSKTPTQAKTIAEATQATTIIEKGLDLYVVNGSPSQAVLAELKTSITILHNALKAAQAAEASGNSATAAAALATFNQALAAYQAYAVSQGVST